MCFQESKFCFCGIPLWVGALYIGMAELMNVIFWGVMGWDMAAAQMLGNAVWLALLFIPSVFYNGNMRKTIFIIYSICTIMTVCSLLVFTVVTFGMRDNLPNEFR